MKIVKTFDNEINTTINGVQLKIDTAGITVSDEVAAECHVQFGHLVDVSDVPEVVKEEPKKTKKHKEVPTEETTPVEKTDA